jgi:hypothetical protein
MDARVKSTMQRLALWLAVVGAGCGPTARPGDDAATTDGGADRLAADAGVASDGAPGACATLAAGATCRLSGAYQLAYDQVVIESTPDPSGMSCRQAVGRSRVVFTPTGDRLCADVDELVVSDDGCRVQLVSRVRTSAASEWWTNETQLMLTFAGPDAGAWLGTGTARLAVSGFLVCTKTATVTARPATGPT